MTTNLLHQPLYSASNLAKGRQLTRILHCLLIIAFFCWQVPPNSAGAQAPCQELLPHGLYTGTANAMVDFTYRHVVESPPTRVVINDTGQITINVGCTVTSATNFWTWHRVIYAPNGNTMLCTWTDNRSQMTGSVVVGSNGQPQLDIGWGPGAVEQYNCPGPRPDASDPMTWHFSLSGPPQGRTMSGTFRVILSEVGELYEEPINLIREGEEIVEVATFTRSWTLTRQPQPAVQGLDATLRQYFLAGIPVTNHYTAALDWDGADPGSARLIVGGDAPRSMTVEGNSAGIDLPLASIPGTGTFPLSVEAELEGRVARLDGLGPLTLVAVPGWANRFNLQPEVKGDHVRYSGGYALPQQPLDAHVTLPTVIPYIGGTWGLLPTQLQLVLAANSLGTRKRGGLTAQGGFGLGKRIYALGAQGNIYGTITPTALTFESDLLELSTPPISFREQLGLVSVIPGASTLFALPVIGDLLQALDGTLGVSAEIHGAMTGRAHLGVSGENLQLTEGGYDAAVGVRATGGLDTPVVWVTVAGGGDGTLKMQIVPTSKVDACQVLLSFVARAGALGYSVVQVQEAWPLYTCTAAGTQAANAATAQARLSPRTIYGAASAPFAEQSVTQVQITNGLTETILAENATVQAQPQLAMAADGRMALAWNSSSSSGAADAITLRLFDGTTWQAALVISETDRPAFTPTAAFTANGTLLVAWAEAQRAPDPAGLTTAFASALEISWAEINPTTGAILQRGLVTQDAVMDFAPRLRRAGDGTIWLSWQQSPSANLVGTVAAPNQFKTTTWTGMGWSAVETAGENSVGTLFWDVVSVDDSQVWLVADVDMDGNFATGADRELYLYQRTAAGWAAPLRLTNDNVIDSGPLLAVDGTGQPVLAWRHGESVLGLVGDPATTTPQPWFDDGAGVGAMLAGGRLLVNNDGTRVLLWPEGTAKGQDLWQTRFDPKTERWSEPTPLFGDSVQRRALSAALQPDGGIAVGLVATPVISETVEFAGGGTAMVPAVGEAARLLVAHIPAGFTAQPPEGNARIFLPVVMRE